MVLASRFTSRGIRSRPPMLLSYRRKPVSMPEMDPGRRDDEEEWVRRQRGGRSLRFARIDQSPVARWWWTVDRWSLVALGVLIAFGVVLSLAASPAVADRLGYDGLHFFRHHVAAVPLAAGL